MPASFLPAPADLFRFLPEIILTIAGTLIMVVEAATGNSRLTVRISPGRRCLPLSVAALSPIANPGPAFSNMLLIDGFAHVLPRAGHRRGPAGLFFAVGYLEREAPSRASSTPCCCSRWSASA